jgi:hypothetical protein
MANNLHRFNDFLVKQNHTWKLSADNYRGLNHVEERSFFFDDFCIKVQYNPERMRSSAAKVDSQSIAARKCFLCGENRPVEQMNLELGSDFILLVNPFPIFKSHFTIPSVHHVPQRLLHNLEAMLTIARQMEGFLLFYNGPECGASAPDHLHFQAGETGFLPVESEFETLKGVPGSLLLHSGQLKIWAFDHYLRKMITFESGVLEQVQDAFTQVYRRFSIMQAQKEEPMINLLCYFSKGKWVVHLFPRKLHRPAQFFAEGDQQLLISPASVDFGGVFITPRREDFDKIRMEDIRDIFSQVSLDDDNFLALKETMKNI